MWIKDFPIMKNLSYLGHEKSVEILDVSLTLEMAIYVLKSAKKTYILLITLQIDGLD